MKMAAAVILNFRIREILLADGVQRTKRHNRAKFCQNWSILCRDNAFFQFLKMATVRHLGFVWGHIWTTHRVIGVVYHCAKFGYDRCSSFDSMNVSIFGAFGWKKVYSRPQIGILGTIWPPKWAAISTKSQKGRSLREFASFETLSVTDTDAVALLE